MPVLFDSTAQGTTLVLGGSASGSKTITHRVSTFARDRVVAYVWVLWTGAVDVSGATFSATFGGESMTLIGSRTWDSTRAKFMCFKLEDAPRGSQAVVVSFASMPTELITRNLHVISETYSGVEAVADAVTAGGSNTTVNTVTTASVKPAHRVASGHAIGEWGALSAYTLTKRQATMMFGGGAMVVGDTPGAASVVSTATNNLTTPNWGAIAVAMTPSVVEITASQQFSLTQRADLAGLRFADPFHLREFWVKLPADEDNSLVASDTVVRSPSGVLMPVWVKDVDDVLEYTIHWDALLADDDWITTVEHTASGSLRVFSEYPTAARPPEPGAGNMTQVWLSGSTNTVTHPVRVRFTTERGRRHDFTFYIAGVQN